MSSTYHPEKIRHRKLEPYVETIRKRYAAGEPIKRMARELGVHHQSVRAIVRGEAYPE